MKVMIFAPALFLGLLGSSAFAARYQVKVTNGGEMPISPVAVYVSDTEATTSALGMPATPGFIKLCQTGNPDLRLQELDAEPAVRSTYRTNGLLFPGMSETIQVEVRDPLSQKIHFEAMYGKSKDACATFTVQSATLVELAHEQNRDSVGQDRVVATGAFYDPALPAGADTTTGCAGLSSAVDCLRSLATAKAKPTLVRAFPGYLPSVLSALEHAFGSMEAQNLVIPAAGALTYQVKLIGTR